MENRNRYYRVTYVDNETGECWDKAPKGKYKIIYRKENWVNEGKHWVEKKTTIVIEFLPKQLELWI